MFQAPILLTLLACGSTPTVSSIDPAESLPGKPVKVLGEEFPADATLWLVQGDEAVQVTEAEVRGKVLLEATLPADLAAGNWTVELRAGDTTAALPDALTVVAPEVEAPCGGSYKANTQVSLPRDLVVIDRFYEDGERETLRIPIGEIAGVEYELVELEETAAEGEPALCSVIYLRRDDDRRVVFDDDTRLNLEPRAYKLGNAMKKPTKTTRKDVEEDPRPVEEN